MADHRNGDRRLLVQWAAFGLLGVAVAVVGTLSYQSWRRTVTLESTAHTLAEQLGITDELANKLTLAGGFNPEMVVDMPADYIAGALQPGVGIASVATLAEIIDFGCSFSQAWKSKNPRKIRIMYSVIRR